MFTVLGAAVASSETSKVPVVVLKVAVYCLVVSMVMGGAAVYFWLADGRVVGVAGQPAFTATSLAWAWSLALAPFPAAVVVVVTTLDWEATLLFLPETRKTIPTMTAAMTTMMMPLRICLRRFWL